MFVVEAVRSTVPVYPADGVTVTVVEPEPPEPEEDITLMVLVPVDEPKVESPE